MNDQITKLEVSLEECAEPHRRLNLTANLIRQYQFVDLVRAWEYAESIPSIIAGEPDDSATARAYRGISLYFKGGIRMHSGAFGEAEAFLERAYYLLADSDADPQWEMRVLAARARCLSLQGDYPGSVDLLYDLLDKGRDHGETQIRLSALMGLGIAYSELGEHQKAADFHEQALHLARELDDDVFIVTELGNLAWDSLQMGDLEEAVANAQEAIALAREANFTNSLAYQYHTMAAASLGLGKRQEAAHFLDRAEEVVQKSGQNQVLALIRHFRGTLLRREGRYQEALAAFSESRDLFQKCGYRSGALSALEAMAHCHKELGDYQQAFSLLETHHAEYVEVFDRTADQRLETREVEFRTAAARREAELLQRKNEELERRVAERTRALEETLNREQRLVRKLEKALRREAELSSLKSRIINTVSHEFRTPLTVVNGSVDILVQYDRELSPEKLTQVRSRIREATHYLTDLLQDILLVQTTQEYGVIPSPVALERALFQQRLQRDLWSHTGNAQWVNFDFRGLQAEVITTDYNLLCQIVANLLSNALKYSPPGEPIDVVVRGERDLVVEVRDQGVGIPSAELGYIWDLFYRASNVDERRGMGLGLYIVREICNALGGTIEVHSPGQDGGSVFILTVPNVGR